jgi:hypothetical protein
MNVANRVGFGRQLARRVGVGPASLSRLLAIEALAVRDADSAAFVAAAHFSASLLRKAPARFSALTRCLRLASSCRR